MCKTKNPNYCQGKSLKYNVLTALLIYHHYCYDNHSCHYQVKNVYYDQRSIISFRKNVSNFERRKDF